MELQSGIISCKNPIHLPTRHLSLEGICSSHLQLAERTFWSGPLNLDFECGTPSSACFLKQYYKHKTISWIWIQSAHYLPKDFQKTKWSHAMILTKLHTSGISTFLSVAKCLFSGLPSLRKTVERCSTLWFGSYDVWMINSTSTYDFLIYSIRGIGTLSNN